MLIKIITMEDLLIFKFLIHFIILLFVPFVNVINLLNVNSYVFVTDANEAYVHFHSDYSVSSSGFHLKWNVVDMSGCSAQSLTASEGHVVSPNYPNFILPSLDCIIVIMAPGKLCKTKLCRPHKHGYFAPNKLQTKLT